ncbi:MAG: hypothetical protein CMJ86_03105 [Planctomycetes bacterium]|nr:hypothetical protein [Planctomycetota bacterium]
MLALLQQSFLDRYFDGLGYAAPFLFLVGAGAGLPVPEEVTMTGSGYLVFAGKVVFFKIVVVCWIATLIGDTIPYLVGRFFGQKALRFKWIARILHPERMIGLTERMQRHGIWAVFTCRFLPGLRMPGFFTAGTLRMPYTRFILVDATAACLMVPLYVLLGRTFGESIRSLERSVADYSEWLGFALLIVLGTFLVRGWVNHRDRQRLAANSNDQGPEKPDLDR